jgi:hypothetical protein
MDKRPDDDERGSTETTPSRDAIDAPTDPCGPPVVEGRSDVSRLLDRLVARGQRRRGLTWGAESAGQDFVEYQGVSTVPPRGRETKAERGRVQIDGGTSAERVAETVACLRARRVRRKKTVAGLVSGVVVGLAGVVAMVRLVGGAAERPSVTAGAMAEREARTPEEGAISKEARASAAAAVSAERRADSPPVSSKSEVVVKTEGAVPILVGKSPARTPRAARTMADGGGGKAPARAAPAGFEDERY